MVAVGLKSRGRPQSPKHDSSSRKWVPSGEYPPLPQMADYTLNVSLKANPIPYGLIAQAIFANIEASFLDTAEHDITLNHGSELVADQVQIANFLAGKAAILEGSSKVSALDGQSSGTHIHPGSGLFECRHSTSGNVGLS
jgi:hypothetical protein